MHQRAFGVAEDGEWETIPAEEPKLVINDQRISWEVDPPSMGLEPGSVLSRGLGSPQKVTGLVVPKDGIRYVALHGATGLSAIPDTPGILTVREQVQEYVPGMSRTQPKIYELSGKQPGHLNLCATDIVGRCFSRLNISVKASDTKLVFFGYLRDKTGRQPTFPWSGIQPLLNIVNHRFFERQTNVSFAFQNQYQPPVIVDIDEDLGNRVDKNRALNYGALFASQQNYHSDL